MTKAYSPELNKEISSGWNIVSKSKLVLSVIPFYQLNLNRHATAEFLGSIALSSAQSGSFYCGGIKRYIFAVSSECECENLPPSHPDHDLEFFHRQMNEEINGLENAARNLVDFPDADWGVRMSIARQASDEARHVQMFRRIMEKRGSWLGRYPVLNFQYRIITNVDNLVGRLAIQNRSFEAEGVDAVEPEIEKARAKGDTELADLFEMQLADEIGHVRFANEYIALVSKTDPMSVMRVGRALHYASQAFCGSWDRRP